MHQVFLNLCAMPMTPHYLFLYVFKKIHQLCPTGNCESLINSELENVVVWLNANKLSLNVSKTKFMIFHNRQFNVENQIPNLKICGTTIERVNEFSFLGIIINENLTWKSHIRHISKKISQTVGVMNRIKSFVPKICLKHIYQSLIHSHLNYGILIWGFDIEKLKTLQKKAIRLLSKSHYLAHTEPLFKNENILKIDDIFKLHCYKFYYNFMNNLLPSPIQSLFHINQTNNNYHLETFNCPDASGKKRIRYTLPHLINTTSSMILTKVYTHSQNGFKIYIKKHILNEYDDSPCVNENCYSCSIINS